MRGERSCDCDRSSTERVTQRAIHKRESEFEIDEPELDAYIVAIRAARIHDLLSSKLNVAEKGQVLHHSPNASKTRFVVFSNVCRERAGVHAS